MRRDQAMMAALETIKQRRGDLSSDDEEEADMWPPGGPGRQRSDRRRSGPTGDRYRDDGWEEVGTTRGWYEPKYRQQADGWDLWEEEFGPQAAQNADFNPDAAAITRDW